MAAIDFPSNPSTNDTFTAAGKTWIWDGEKWILSVQSTTYQISDLEVSLIMQTF